MPSAADRSTPELLRLWMVGIMLIVVELECRFIRFVACSILNSLLNEYALGYTY